MAAVRTCDHEDPADSAPSGPWTQPQAQPLEVHLRTTVLLQSRRQLPRPAASSSFVEGSEPPRVYWRPVSVSVTVPI